jgi:bifunctional non-homologous end joining protein LigD
VDLLDQIRQKGDEFDIEVAGCRLHLSNLERVMWPATSKRPSVTKRDLIDYYARVAEFMVPHLRDRPLGFVQYPKGLGTQRKFNRHWLGVIPEWIRRVEIFSIDKREATEHLIIEDLPSLLWFAQISVFELHPWYSRVTLERGLGEDFSSSEAAIDASVLNYPDFLVIDLDPNIASPDSAWDKTVEAALVVRTMLDGLSLRSYVKTSGKSGIHIFIPIKRIYDYDSVRALARTIGEAATGEAPGLITLELRTAHRPEKVFFDYNQNVRAKTLVAPFSTREAAGAPVSMPVAWEQLQRVKPEEFHLRNVPALLDKDGDKWADILEEPQEFRFRG